MPSIQRPSTRTRRHVSGTPRSFWWITATLGYTKRIPTTAKVFAGRELTVQLTIRNLANQRTVYYQDDGVTLRPPDGDYTKQYRVAVPGRIASFQRPINFELMTTVKF